MADCGTTKQGRRGYSRAAMARGRKPEHIVLNALGGRKTTKNTDCAACNNKFGGTSDAEVGTQVEVLRNMLQLDSGTGRAPPDAAKDSVGKRHHQSFERRHAGTGGQAVHRSQADDGSFEVQITTKSVEELLHFPYRHTDRLMTRRRS